MKWQFIENQSYPELQVTLTKASYDQEVLDLITLLDNVNQTVSDIISIKVEDGIQFLRLEDLQAVDVEAGWLILTTNNGQLRTRERLSRFKERYLSSDFVQISRQTIININYLERLEASFSGNMTAFLGSSYKTTVSRRYLKTLEKALGL